MRNGIRLLFILFSVSCSTPSTPHLETQNALPIITVDQRGCMNSSEPNQLPSKPENVLDAQTVVEYYEKLEWNYLISAERCFSNETYCGQFETLSLKMQELLLPNNSTNEDVDLTTRNSTNKLIAMMAINTLAYQKQYGKKIDINTWLTLQTNKNDFTRINKQVTIRSEKKSFSFRAHNMAATSARAFMYVGLLTGNRRWQQKASSHIATIVQTLRNDGSLPLETRRGSRGLRYSMQVLSDLVAITAFSDKKIWERHKTALLKMKDYDLSVLENNSKIIQYAKENFSPGPITDYNKQDISSLRSRLAWLPVLGTLDQDAVDTVRSLKIDKSACSEEIMKNKKECGLELQIIDDLIKSPLGFTLGFNPRCVDIRNLH